MNGLHPTDPENLFARIKYLENNRRFVQNMLEMALSLVDFQENIINGYGPEQILEEAEKRIRYLIPFESAALYLVNQDTADFQLALCNPPQAADYIAAEVEHSIQKGFFAWAVRERREIAIASQNRTRRLLLHVIATHSRIRGMFVGLLDDRRLQIPDSSLTLFSIILLNTANALESLEFYRLLRHQKTILERQVEERTQALAESERQVQQVLKLQAIGTLAGGIAHDFNNILFPIIGYTELSMDEVPENSQIHSNLKEVLKAANRAKDLVQQILTFSRQNGRERKPVQVDKIIRETLSLLRASIPKTIDIVCDLDQGCKPVMGDPTQIHQVLMNLCTNAYHAMQETGGTIQVRLTQTHIDYEETLKHMGIKMGPHLHLMVKDEGVGMDSSVLSRIFEPYFTTKEPGKGTGLGLSVIHGIVKNHGGYITVDSSPGRGSAFHVYLPTIEESEIELEKEPYPSNPRGSERILLVDDEPQLLAMEKQLIEKLGYRVTSCPNAGDALKALEEEPDQFDLIITDMTMPQMTGDQLARQAWKIRSDLPVILCTGYNEMMSEEKAIEMGIRKFLLKPVEKEELADAIRRSLNPASAPPPYLALKTLPA
jgi:signal transduction histidine kinase/CheY-like chemotaxis protein